MEAFRYQPSPTALERLSRVRFVPVIGPTAVGKTTMIRAAMARNASIHLVVGRTSRPQRPGEQDGIDYHFETRAAMEAAMARGEYAQVAPPVFDDWYASSAADYSTEGIAVFPTLADAMPQFEALPFREHRPVFVLPPGWASWQPRIESHGFTPQKWVTRSAEARRSLQFAQTYPGLHFVISREIETAANDFITIVSGQPYGPALTADQAAAPAIIEELLAHLPQQPTP